MMGARYHVSVFLFEQTLKNFCNGVFNKQSNQFQLKIKLIYFLFYEISHKIKQVGNKNFFETVRFIKDFYRILIVKIKYRNIRHSRNPDFLMTMSSQKHVFQDHFQRPQMPLAAPLVTNSNCNAQKVSFEYILSLYDGCKISRWCSSF